MNTLTRMRDARSRSQERRRQLRTLRRQLEDYRTPSERAELEAILERHDTTVSELLGTGR
jgi:hypothetical protein